MQTLFEKLAKCQTPGEVERMLAGNGLQKKIFNEILNRLPLVHYTDPAQLYPKIRDAISNGIEAAIKAGKEG